MRPGIRDNRKSGNRFSIVFFTLNTRGNIDGCEADRREIKIGKEKYDKQNVKPEKEYAGKQKQYSS